MLKSKRQLFSKPKAPKQKKAEAEPKTLPPFLQKPKQSAADEQPNDFFAFVSQQEKASAQN